MQGKSNKELAKQRIVLVGAGSAGMGVARMLALGMVKQVLIPASPGVHCADMTQDPFASPDSDAHDAGGQGQKDSSARTGFAHAGPGHSQGTAASDLLEE